jgi:hypothetical protein
LTAASGNPVCEENLVNQLHKILNLNPNIQFLMLDHLEYLELNYQLELNNFYSKRFNHLSSLILLFHLLSIVFHVLNNKTQ